MPLKFIDEADFNKKKVIARFDFNTPLRDGKISDPTRIEEALPTINYILNNGAEKLVLMGHLGRPKGHRRPELSLEPIATYLAEKLNQEVILTTSCTDESIKTLLSLSTTKIVLLENLRFHPEEKKNEKEFAKVLASYADIYVNDAFGTAHRKHASTHKINAYFKNNAFAGFLLKKEIENLSKVIESPEKPFMAIIGGVKVSDKIKAIESLLPKVQKLFIGGAMAYPFLKAKGINIGKGLCSEDDIKLAQLLLKQDKGSKITLPIDHIASESFDGNPTNVSQENIPENLMGLDIGPQTVELFERSLKTAKTIFWNGPMGVFENEHFNKGTFQIARILSESSGLTVVGGGDSVNAVNKSGVSKKINHISTGGGASLEFVEKGSLPGINALKFGVE